MKASQQSSLLKTAKRIFLAGCCLAPAAQCSGQSSEQLPLGTPSSAPEVMQYAQPVMQQHQMLGTQAGTVDRCNLSICNPPMQPTVAKGRCQPCTVAVDCADSCGGRQGWKDMHPYDFQPLAHGEYVGPVRLPAMRDYRVRVGDRLQFTYIRSREQVDNYRLQVGDELQITSFTDEDIRLGDIVQGRGAVIQPDGTIICRLIGPVHAHGLTISQLRHNLEIAYKDKIKDPSIDVLPIATNTALEDILASVDARAGQGGRNFFDQVHPDGTIRLPKVGAICVQGLTLDEIKREANLRYRQIAPGLEIEPRIDQEAQSFVFVYGEVAQPNRYELLGPTSVTQALAQAGSIIPQRGNNRSIVIFRRAEDWRMVATKVDLRGAHLGKVPLPTDEIWLRNGDLIIVPPTPIARFDDFVQTVFQQGVYGIFPFAQVGEGFNANGFIQN